MVRKCINHQHLNKKVKIKGKVISVSEVKPQVVSARFECPSCKAIISVLQTEKTFREPDSCDCGRKEDFRLLSKEMIDCQRIVLAQGGLIYDEVYQKKIPSHRVSVFLSGDLCNPEKKVFDIIGHLATVTGIVKEVPVLNDFGEISVRFDIAIDAISLERSK